MCKKSPIILLAFFMAMIAGPAFAGFLPTGCKITVLILRPHQGDILTKLPFGNGACPQLDGSIEVDSVLRDPAAAAYAETPGTKLYFIVDNDSVVGPNGTMDNTGWTLDSYEDAYGVHSLHDPAPVYKVQAACPNKKPMKKSKRRHAKKHGPAKEKGRTSRPCSE